MTRYVISDLHLGHESIIDMCDRPFESVGEMDSTLIQSWNQTVDTDDIVYFVGDLAFETQQRTVEETVSQLNGDIVFLVGNHDKLKPEELTFPVIESCVIREGKYRFWCSHRPSTVPDDWSQWVLHGHLHNNELYEYPFLYPQNNTVNVSAEVLDYVPRPLGEIAALLDKGDKRRQYSQQ